MCLPGIECAGNKIFLAISPLSQHAHARNITVLCRGLRPLSTSTRSPRAWENVRRLFVLCAQTGCSMRHQHATGVSKCCRSGCCLISFFPRLALRRLLSRRRQDTSGQEVGAFPDVVLGKQEAWKTDSPSHLIQGMSRKRRRLSSQPTTGYLQQRSTTSSSLRCRRA